MVLVLPSHLGSLPENISLKKFVLIFSTVLSEIFLTLRRPERDMIINVYWSTSTAPIILLSDFNET